MKNIFILIFLGIWTNSLGQDLHTPSEIKDIIDKSFKYYSFKEVKDIARGKMLSLLEDDYYFGMEEGEKTLKQYNIKSNPKNYKKYEKALKLEMGGKYSQARKIYQKFLKNAPSNAIYNTRIGWTFFYENNYTEAVKWARKATRENSLHYPAYILLTNIYMTSNKYSEAIKTITQAHLLNRNDRTVIKLLKEVYHKNGLIYDDTWAYVTQYKVSKSSDNEILIEYNLEPWRAYAACRAVWEYEPYYMDKMLISDKDTVNLREYECLLNMAIAYENWDKNKFKKQFTMGLALQTAMKENMIKEFIQFEIRLAENPKMVFFLTDEEIKTLSKYIIQVKSIEIPKNTNITEGN